MLENIAGPAAPELVVMLGLPIKGLNGYLMTFCT